MCGLKQSRQYFIELVYLLLLNSVLAFPQFEQRSFMSPHNYINIMPSIKTSDEFCIIKFSLELDVNFSILNFV